MARYDIALVSDPRFKGGTRSAMMSDVSAFKAGGLRTAILPVFSKHFFGDFDASTTEADFEEFHSIDGVEIVLEGAPIEADITFFHHPAIFQHLVSNSVEIKTRQAFLVTHHPLFKGDGSMEFDPFAIQKTIRRQFSVAPIWAPISGLCRAHYTSLAPLIRISTEDWRNTFDTDDWISSRSKLTDPDLLVIGRHGRPHPDKWPTERSLIEASLPTSVRTQIRVMGAPQDLLNDLEVDVSDWDLVPFKGETPQAFLNSLDIFSYFHAPSWVEAFGRTIAEAMLLGVRCILPHTLKTTFGPHAHYCYEFEVPKLIESIRGNLEAERRAAMDARDWARQAFNTTSTLPRLERFKRDNGSRQRMGAAAFPPLQTTRKLIGIKRRNHTRFAKL